MTQEDSAQEGRAADVLVEQRDRVLSITLNRPDKLNALSAEMIDGAIEALESAAVDPGVGAVLVTGTGRAFCAGGDVSAMSREKGESTYEQRVDRLRHGQRLSWLLHSLPKPTLAAVNGYAMGAGLGIALSCDLRVASEAAKLGTAYAKVGFGGDFGVTWQLTRLLGPARAKELLFFADVVEAAEAERLGLVNRVVAVDGFADQAHALAQRLATGPTVSYRWMKENVNLAVTSDFGSLLDREAITHLRCGETEDHREGVAAFLEKRAPSFQGR